MPDWLPQVFNIGQLVFEIVGGSGVVGLITSLFLPEKTTTTIGCVIGTVIRVVIRQKSFRDTKAGKAAKTVACLIDGVDQGIEGNCLK